MKAKNIFLTVFVMITVCALFLSGCEGIIQSGSNEPALEEETEPEPEPEQDPESETEPEPEPEAEPEPEPVPVLKTVTVSATGDCAIGRVQVHGYEGSFEAFYDSYGPDYFLENVRDIFTSDDLSIVNLECVLSNETQRVEKTFNIKGKPEYVAILTGSGIEAASLGNNHSADYGEQSLIDTKNTLDDAGILYAINDKTAVWESPEGVKVGMVSVSLLSGYERRAEYLYDGIDSLKNECDLVVCLLHWGIEREYYPTDFQREMAHNCIDRGADLVIGNHPHVLQGTELYNGKMICYSLGNFCFGANRNPTDKDTMVFQQTFTFEDGTLKADTKVRIIPCLLSSASGYNDYRPMIAEGDAKTRIINNVNKYSAPYGSISFDGDGNLVK